MTYNFTPVLGDNWFQTFTQFRINPDYFFDKRKLTREAFCRHVLKDIYLDHIDVQCKIHLLLLLHEHSNTLIKDINLLEQIIGSILNLFTILKSSPENRLLKNQILITVTTIILTSDIENETKELMCNIKTTLLGIISSGSEDPVVVSGACKCLEEIEACFPTSLVPEIKNILLSCENHLSPAFQNYASLLSLCIKNMCLKSYSVESPDDDCVRSDYEKNKIHLPTIVSYLMELVPLMSSMTVYCVMKNLIPVVKHSSNISSMVFKLSLPNLIFSSEVLYFHLAFDVLEDFHSELFTIQEQKCLFRQLMLKSSHPCLTMSHRMLFLDWLKSCLLNKEIFSCSFPLLKSLLPGPFDGPITQEKKSCILALYISKSFETNLGLDILNESIGGLRKCALFPNGTRAVASFFRILFVYFSYYKHELMHDHLYKLLLGIMKTSPHLLPYSLSFLDSVKTEFPDSTFPKEALTHLVDHILSLPLKQFLSNLECYLSILEQATEICGSDSKPRSVLRLLQKLLADSESFKMNVWEFGNNILSVCQSILKHHDVQFFYYDLAEILCLISQNVNDIDVKDRAKIYYSALTALSKLKVQSIFKIQSPKKDLNALTSFVPGVNTNLQFAPCVQVLTKSILQLVRLKKVWDNASDDTASLQITSDIDVLNIYRQHLASSDLVVQLPFILKHISDSEKIFNCLYGVVISTQSSSPCKEIAVIQLPVFQNLRTNSEENILQLDIIPFESQPLDLQFKIEFTCSNGYSYVCHPDPIVLNFKDFFLPLPVPHELQNYNPSWRENLFEILWKELEEKTSCGLKEMECCKSTLCLSISKEELILIINDNWKQFIVSRSDEFKYWIAIFLPPKSHLLVKIDIINEKPFINFIVDDISILLWTALYLQEIMKF